MMNKVIISMLFLLHINLLSDTTIDLKIKQIQNASPQERVRLMNEFKKALRIMNNDTRIKAIQAIQAKQNLDKINKSAKNTIQNNSLQNNLQQVQSISKQIGEITHEINHNIGGL